MITAAFAAVEALTRALAVELGPLRVNSIRPATPTPRCHFLPQDIADAAVFLMTNPQVTGAVLEVTGGETLVNTLE